MCSGEKLRWSVSVRNNKDNSYIVNSVELTTDINGLYLTIDVYLVSGGCIEIYGHISNGLNGYIRRAFYLQSGILSIDSSDSGVDSRLDNIIFITMDSIYAKWLIFGWDDQWSK